VRGLGDGAGLGAAVPLSRAQPPAGTCRQGSALTWRAAAGSSVSPSSRPTSNRARHQVTVPRLTPSHAATAVLLRPSAQASTIRARSASPCAVLRRLAPSLQPLPLGIGQHQRLQPAITHDISRPQTQNPVTTEPDLKRNTTHGGDV
jgi:hypothetical protein